MQSVAGVELLNMLQILGFDFIGIALGLPDTLYKFI